MPLEYVLSEKIYYRYYTKGSCFIITAVRRIVNIGDVFDTKKNVICALHTQGDEITREHERHSGNAAFLQTEKRE